ncbi:MAG: hypothetical protein Q4C22_04165 [Bacillota bacterium]|nr:hypothetical protein [Bacillota bacterium]
MTKMIESDKILPLFRLILYKHPHVEQIMEDIGETVKKMSVDAEPVRHGRWIDGYCNRCGNEALAAPNSETLECTEWCPWCGAKMEEAEE